MAARDRNNCLCAVRVILFLYLASGLNAAPSRATTVPEPYPGSDRFPASVLLPSAQALDLLQGAAGVVVDKIVSLDGRGFAPEPGASFRPLTATVYVTPAEFDWLEEKGLSPRAIPNEGLRAFRIHGPGTRGPEGWPTYEEWVARMWFLASARPEIVRMVSIGQSVQGREIWMLKITDRPDEEEDEPEVRYSSTMHGDEPVGSEMVLRLAELLAWSYGSHAGLTDLVDEMEIWLCPLHNPDGYVLGTRFNANGVDLNRDFPDPVTDPVDRPEGREPETQALASFI